MAKTFMFMVWPEILNGKPRAMPRNIKSLRKMFLIKSLVFCIYFPSTFYFIGDAEFSSTYLLNIVKREKKRQ